jgi:SET domain-containing protein
LNCISLYPILEHEYLGVAIDPLVSIMNHSCDPNANISVEGTYVRVRSLRKIEAGEEITWSYTDTSAPKWIRQPALKDGWGFDCACKRESYFSFASTQP